MVSFETSTFQNRRMSTHQTLLLVVVVVVLLLLVLVVWQEAEVGSC